MGDPQKFVAIWYSQPYCPIIKSSSLKALNVLFYVCCELLIMFYKLTTHKLNQLHIIRLGILCVQYGVYPCQCFSDSYITLHAEVYIALCVPVLNEECLLGSGQYESTS